MEKVSSLQVRRKQGKSNRASKICSWTFFDCEDIARQEFFSPKSNGWPEMLQGGFTTSKGARLPKRPLWWQYQDWLIHLDNTRVHIVLTVAILAAISGLVSMLADLAPYDLFSFPKVLLQLRIYRLKNMLTVLHAVPKVNYSCASISGGNAGPVV